MDMYNRNANLLALYRGAGKTSEELKNAYQTANQENDPDLADGLAEILDEKFPGWDLRASVQKKRGTTHVTYGNQSKSFPSSKQAYIWLVELMLSSRPMMNINDHVLNVMFIGVKRMKYLALDPLKLFPRKIGRAADPNSYHLLSNGWFLNTKLNSTQIRDKIISLGAVCELRYNDDWSWYVDAETDGNLDSFDEMVADNLAKKQP